MKIIKKKLADLRHPEKNARKHGQKQIAEYIRSIKMFGQIRPLVIDETGVILSGNGLYDALASMGIDTVDCYVISGLTDRQKTKLMLADNKVYDLGSNDMDVLTEMIQSLGEDIDVPGFEAELLETINASIQQVDEIIEEYGQVDQEYANRLNQRAEHPPVQNTSSDTPNLPVMPPPQINTGIPSNESEGPGNAPQRIVICPKCGERIVCP